MYSKLRSTIQGFMITAFVVLALSFSSFVSADTLGQQQNFIVNKDFDVSGRSTVGATLVVSSDHAYWYVDNTYYNNLFPSERSLFISSLNDLAKEFDANIYPKETQFWGSEPNPGIDNDPHLTILLERLRPNTGGYFDTSNGISRKEAPESNQREMITVALDSLADNRAKVFLAHEFQHLISFNQKELAHRVSEDVWLNELRSQYAITVAGYNDNSRNSDLRLRSAAFLTNPTDSLTEWPNTTLDYASITLFGEYLAERFGPSILPATLKSSKTGIESVNEYLATHNYTERFNDVFADWVLANYINNPVLNSAYGYTNPTLQGFSVPVTDNERLFYPAKFTFAYSIKPWQSEWFRFNLDPNQPSSRSLHIVDNDTNQAFKVRYIDNLGQVKTFTHETFVNNAPGLSWFVLMPLNSSKISDFTINDPATPYTLSIDYVDRALAVQAALSNGALIKHTSAPDNNYVIEGQYKRYLSPAVIKLYGHLDPSKSITVPEEDFDKYVTSNYVRNVNDKKVYTVWPDGTKHWLNITAQRFNESGRDWNSIFVINDLEFNSYQMGAPITQ
ncbi:hypothetical protein KW791_01685 [Candidatus Parcubacteria bacterium]|nr:hypothetical protein [Candidatus Parcubacteria bacterium]